VQASASGVLAARAIAARLTGETPPHDAAQ
jgi:hypothetical protein